MRGRRHLYLAFAPLILLSQVRIDQRLGEFRAQEEILYVWSGSHVKRLAPGLENLMADVYWLRTVQYYGGQRVYAQDKRFDLLAPLVNITTTLDARFSIAYRYGAIFLSEPWPLGAGRVEEGVAFLARGAPLVPEGWRLRQQEGYFTFLFLKNAERASQILLEAAKMPGAPYWLETLAGEILLKGGERQTARVIWSRMYEQSEEGALRANALSHLQTLDALDWAEALEKQIEGFHQRLGRRPRSLEELRSAGMLKSPAVDPAGVPFDYDPASGRIRISRSSRVWRPETDLLRQKETP